MKTLSLGLAFAGLLAFQLSPSALLAWQQTHLLKEGRSVRLSVTTRDPRHLLRGEYSTLAYDIGRLEGLGLDAVPEDFQIPEQRSCTVKTGRDVYVRLVPDAEGIHRADAVFFSRPPGDDTVIKGRITFGTLERQGEPMRFRPVPVEDRPMICQRFACLTASVTYGIEQWYGAQGVPAQLDRTPRKDILVDVRVGSNGSAVIDALTVNGQTFASTTRLW